MKHVVTADDKDLPCAANGVRSTAMVHGFYELRAAKYRLMAASCRRHQHQATPVTSAFAHT